MARNLGRRAAVVKRVHVGVQVDKLVPVWRPSVNHFGVRVAWIGTSKVAVMALHGEDKWQAKVFLAFEEGHRVKVLDTQEEAEEWCLATIRLWFKQLDD